MALASVQGVTLTLTVRAAEWNRHVDQLAASAERLVPVVKGNGYGFGRDWLAQRAAGLAPTLAVGTVHEVSSVPANHTAVVLTPTLDLPADLRSNVVITVGNADHLHAAARQPGRSVLVKVRSSMNRYGVDPQSAGRLADEARGLGLIVRGYSIHPPRAGTSAAHAAEIDALVRQLDPSTAVWVSHVDVDDYNRLRDGHPAREWNLRLGTTLWHGDKSALRLSADVLDVRAVRAGDIAGYRSVPVRIDGTMVIIGCGTAHGIAPLDDGLSPFHHARHRMPLHEPPHMHTSMCVVPHGDPVPSVGESVDVQRPLITTSADIIRWA